MTGSPQRLPLLDGLRGVAAIMVMLHHESGLYGTAWPLPRAYVAVDFFFMLSGLVLTPVFEPRLRAGLTPERFMVQRLARLWPVLAVGIVIGAAHFWPQGAPMGVALLLTGLALIPMLGGGGAIYRLDGSQWSVSFELIANYVHARLLARWSDRAVLGFAVACGVVLAGLIAYFGTVGIGDITTNWWAGFARVGFAYALGVWMGRMRIAGKAAPAVPWWLAAMPLPLALGLLPFVPVSRMWGDGLAVFVVLPLALWLAAGVRVFHGPVARACAALGALSYPIYTLHVPVLRIGRDIALAQPLVDRLPIRLGAVAVTLLAAWALAASPLAKGWRKKGAAKMSSAAPLSLKP